MLELNSSGPLEAGLDIPALHISQLVEYGTSIIDKTCFLNALSVTLNKSLKCKYRDRDDRFGNMNYKPK